MDILYKYFINTNSLITTVNQLFPAVSNFLCNFIRIYFSKIALIIAFLKSKNIGILFVNENIDTLNEDSELMLSFVGSFAQDESYNKSQNIKLGFKQAIKTGRGKDKWSKRFVEQILYNEKYVGDVRFNKTYATVQAIHKERREQTLTT